MRRADMDSAIRRVRDVRLALAGLLVLSMTANLALTMSFAGRETVTVLLPAAAGPAWEVGGGGVGINRAGARYLEDMARTATVTLLTLTPENAAHVRRAAARLSHASARGAIGAWVEAEAARMAGRDMASAFYPMEIEADPDAADRGDRGRAGDLDRPRGSGAGGPALPAGVPHRRRADRAPALRTDGEWMMTKPDRRPRGTLAAICLTVLAALAAPIPAEAMQILDAADHAELAAEISATGVNRIALAGDRIAKVVRAPDGFAVEHDATTGDLYLRPLSQDAGADGDPITLFVGTERGFTYRLTLTLAERDSAQILIRNAAALPGSVDAPGIAGSTAGTDAHVAALVRLVRAVARREPLSGYAIRASGQSPHSGLTLIETWRGPRFAALVFEAARPASPGSWSGAGGDADGAADLAGTIEALPGVGRVAALWLAAPGTGPSGGRLAVAVVEAAPAEAAR